MKENSKQLILGIDKDVPQEKAIDFVRYTIRVPIDVSIHLDMDVSKKKMNKNRWILEAIQDKLDASQRADNEISNLKKEVESLKDLLVQQK